MSGVFCYTRSMYSAISQNKRNTLIIMAVFVAIIGAVGWAVGYINGADYSISVTILICGAVYALIQYFMANKLAMAMTGAQEIQKENAPELWRVVENIAIASGMPMPKVYLIADPRRTLLRLVATLSMRLSGQRRDYWILWTSVS